MNESTVTLFSLYLAFLLDIGIIIYAYVLARRMGFSGDLYKTALFTGLSAFVFGLHHLGEIFLTGVPYGVEVSEAVECVAAVLLMLAAYNIYKVSSGVEQ